MAKHVVVTTEKMQAEYDGTKRVAVRFSEDTDNGLVFKLGDLEEGQREVHKIEDATAGTDGVGTLVLITTPEVEPDERLQSLSDFYNRKGAVGAAHILCEHDIFSDTKEAFVNIDEIETKKYAAVTAGGKITLVATQENAFAKFLDVNQGKYAFKVLTRA